MPSNTGQQTLSCVLYRDVDIQCLSAIVTATLLSADRLTYYFTIFRSLFLHYWTAYMHAFYIECMFFYCIVNCCVDNTATFVWACGSHWMQ